MIGYTLLSIKNCDLFRATMGPMQYIRSLGLILGGICYDKVLALLCCIAAFMTGATSRFGPITTDLTLPTTATCQSYTSAFGGPLLTRGLNMIDLHKPLAKLRRNAGMHTYTTRRRVRHCTS